MRKKKIETTSEIPVIVEQPKVETNEDIERTMEKYRVFAKSLFGDDYEIGKVKIKKGQQDPKTITMLKVKKEFIIAQKGKHNSQETINTYEKHFNYLFDFLGFNYLKQSREILKEVLDNNEKYGTMRQIGASMPVLVLELDNISAFYQDYLENVKKHQEQTILADLRHLRAIIYFAQEKKWIREFKITIKEKQPDIKPTFTKYEIEKLSKKPKIREDNFVEYRSYVMIQYLASTGNRISSMLALNVKDIDFEEGTITVNTQKDKKPKLMPLIYDLRKVLREYIYHARCDEEGNPLYNEPLFCNRTGERLSYTGARDAMKEYFNARGIEWEGFHKFRHSYAANWIRDGGNPFMLKEQLGHSSLAMTNRYANIYGMATKAEAEEHSLSKKFNNTTNRKSIKMKK